MKSLLGLWELCNIRHILKFSLKGILMCDRYSVSCPLAMVKLSIGLLLLIAFTSTETFGQQFDYTYKRQCGGAIGRMFVQKCPRSHGNRDAFTFKSAGEKWTCQYHCCTEFPKRYGISTCDHPWGVPCNWYVDKGSLWKYAIWGIMKKLKLIELKGYLIRPSLHIPSLDIPWQGIR